MYAKTGRRSIPPEQLLKASLLMALHSIPSERAFCEQLDYNILFRWFPDMSVVTPVFDHSVFSVPLRPFTHFTRFLAPCRRVEAEAMRREPHVEGAGEASA